MEWLFDMLKSTGYQPDVRTSLYFFGLLVPHIYLYQSNSKCMSKNTPYFKDKKHKKHNQFPLDREYVTKAGPSTLMELPLSLPHIFAE